MRRQVRRGAGRPERLARSEGSAWQQNSLWTNSSLRRSAIFKERPGQRPFGSETGKEGTDLGAGPILRADELAADDAFAVNDVAFGPHLGVVEIGGTLCGIAYGDEIYVMRGEKVRVGVGIVIDAYGKDDDAGHLVVEVKERGHFCHTGTTPCGPEVEQNNLSAIIGEMDAGIAIGEGEVRGRMADELGTRATVAGGHQTKAGGKKG